MTDALNRDYIVGPEIGRGRYGVVSRCHSAVTGRCFAVKSLDKRALQGDAVEGLCVDNEAKLMRLVSGHKNVLEIFDVYEDADSVHIVMEFCGSGDLYGRITSGEGFDENEARRVMVPLMEAIAHCHRLGVSHRDIKPDNILFNGYDELKLADFGSAEFFGNGCLMSGIVGTPYYVAPEVLAGNEYNEKADIWSAGVILYIMLAGFPPFYGETAEEIFGAVVRANLRFPRGVFGSVSAEAKDLIRRMLCRDASRRFSTDQVLRHPWMANG